MSKASPQEVQDSFDEIERCMWRLENSASRGEWHEWADEVDSEVSSILRGLSLDEKMDIIDRLVSFLEEGGVSEEPLSEVFDAAQMSQEDLAAYRIAKQTPPTSSAASPRRM